MLFERRNRLTFPKERHVDAAFGSSYLKLVTSLRHYVRLYFLRAIRGDFANDHQNIAICATAILIITLPYLINPKVTFAVFVGFVSLMFELFGIMYLWNVSLNAISMIILVMGIGFSVDYSAHIAHAFVKSEKKTTELRVREALETMGSSVAMGGMKFFFFILIYIFYSFFKKGRYLIEDKFFS